MHPTFDDLATGIERADRSPRDAGELRLIVRRPAVEAREVLEEAELDLDVGLVGDTWASRPSRSTDDGSPDPRAQITLVEARVAEVIAGERDRWALFGDQLFVDLDLSEENLPPGICLVLGTAEIEISDKPHIGCAKYSARFGADALRLVMSPDGRRRRLRGANARVTTGGAIRLGDLVRRS